jgi:predicted neutral ceramidase superfamily lipid hydrolase
MESQLYDSSTIPSQEFAESFFSHVPTDSRFLQTSFQKIMPSSSISADIIEFNFERYEGKFFIEINNVKC